MRCLISDTEIPGFCRLSSCSINEHVSKLESVGLVSCECVSKLRFNNGTGLMLDDIWFQSKSGEHTLTWS